MFAETVKPRSSRKPMPSVEMRPLFLMAPTHVPRSIVADGRAWGVDHECHAKYHYGMKTTIDAAGRLVVPKALREQFHLTPGSEIDIESTADGVIIRPAGQNAALVDLAGVLVHHGPNTARIDIAAFVRQERDSRSRRQGPS
jgi:AbrB family looped-hinge helix DNA binding protein